ncbi:MAG: HAMP domain-containing histidine kinase [Saccharofermentans sp.]|nr:HAMP domain-containing histidine kinase [Saccharofermentans sp.]
MKKLIIKEYLKNLIVAIVASILLSATLCFVFFFLNNSVDNDMPQYLVRNIIPHISRTQTGISLNEEGKERLQHHNVWLQVLNESGEVVFEENSKGDLPNEYTMLELTNVVMNSNRLGNYTVFMSDIPEMAGYAILLGCDSKLVSKYTFRFSGETAVVLFGCILVVSIVTLLVVLCASYVFSKKITNPVGDIIDNIDKVQKGERIEYHTSEDNKLFANVFESIEKLEAILKQNDILRAKWIVNISHDIKSPLSTIKGYSELLYDQEYEYSSDEIRTYAEQMLKSEERIRELVEDLKMSNSLIEGKITPTLESVDIVEFVGRCISNASAFYVHDKNVQLENNCKSKSEIDVKLMERCITNIICNAFVHNDTDVEVRISVTESENNTYIRISDNGKGMSEEDLSKVFERYYRGNGSGKTEGTGLGLAIAKEIVLLHGGQIDVTSNPGKGTVFTIRLLNHAN